MSILVKICIFFCQFVFFMTGNPIHSVTCVTPLQAYAYWKSGKINDVASFDLYFRKNPFKGEFTIFAGLTDCLKFLDNFHYSETDISYLKTVLPPNVEQVNKLDHNFLNNLSKIQIFTRPGP